MYPSSRDAGMFGSRRDILKCQSLLTKLSAVLAYMFPICLPSSKTGKRSMSDLTSIDIIPRWIKDLINSSAMNPFGSQGKGIQPREIWFRRPQGAPSGVWTGQTNPQASGRSFRTVVVFYSAK